MHFSNRTEEVRIGEVEGYAEVHVLVREVKFKAKAKRNYHWLKGSTLIVSESGAAGKLLHGRYVSFYDNGQLHQKGKLYRGLKVGEWRTWNDQGRLLQIVNWRMGLLHGSYTTFNALTKDGTTTYYKGGEIRAEKTKREKQPRDKKKKGVESEENSAEGEE